MKVVLLALSGDSAREKLAQLYPDASIESISRAEFETGSVTKRLASLRALRPDVFAIATERLAWQRGQELFMIFGALAGARELAARIAVNGPLAIRASKQLVAGAVSWTDAAAFAAQRELADAVFTSADAQEGARAFAEKRPPVWRSV